MNRWHYDILNEILMKGTAKNTSWICLFDVSKLICKFKTNGNVWARNINHRHEIQTDLFFISKLMTLLSFLQNSKHYLNKCLWIFPRKTTNFEKSAFTDGFIARDFIYPLQFKRLSWIKDTFTRDWNHNTNPPLNRKMKNSESNSY